MSEISVVITAHNEEEKIAKCLDCVKALADEIIVVDNSSTDTTAAIAKKYTKKIYSQKNNPQNIDISKNFGFSKATKEWILSIDADEYMTPELAQGIKKILNGNLGYDGYFISRKNIIFGKWIEHTGWYPDYQLRLFKNGKGKYTSEHVHENIEVGGEVGYIQQALVHENYQTIGQFIQRNLLQYAPNEAQSLLRKGYVFSYLDAIRFPAKEFLSRYFAREGYKDGVHGLVLSLLLAAYHLAIFAFIWEKKKFSQEKELFSIKHIQQESNKIGSEFRYWWEHEQIKNETNPLKKVLLRTKRKLLL